MPVFKLFFYINSLRYRCMVYWLLDNITAYVCVLSFSSFIQFWALFRFTLCCDIVRKFLLSDLWSLIIQEFVHLLIEYWNNGAMTDRTLFVWFGFFLYVGIRICFKLNIKLLISILTFFFPYFKLFLPLIRLLQQVPFLSLLHLSCSNQLPQYPPWHSPSISAWAFLSFTHHLIPSLIPHYQSSLCLISSCIKAL